MRSVAPVPGRAAKGSTTPHSILTPRPAPPGFSTAATRPSQAFWSHELNEYILPYDAVRTADGPDEVLMEFLMSAYDAAASAGNWDRAALECLSAYLAGRALWSRFR